jgi:hypothetical protein
MIPFSSGQSPGILFCYLQWFFFLFCLFFFNCYDDDSALVYLQQFSSFSASSSSSIFLFSFRLFFFLFFFNFLFRFCFWCVNVTCPKPRVRFVVLISKFCSFLWSTEGHVQVLNWSYQVRTTFFLDHLYRLLYGHLYDHFRCHHQAAHFGGTARQPRQSFSRPAPPERRHPRLPCGVGYNASTIPNSHHQERSLINVNQQQQTNQLLFRILPSFFRRYSQ